MSRNAPRASLPVILLASVTAGCSGASDRDPVSTPEQRESATLSRWKKVYTIEIVGGENRRTHEGYLEHRFSPMREERTVYWVYDTHFEPQGFVHPSGKVFAFARDPSGDVTRRELGHEELDDAVLKLLGAKGAIEYTDVSPPRAGRSESTTGAGEGPPPARP